MMRSPHKMLFMPVIIFLMMMTVNSGNILAAEKYDHTNRFKFMQQLTDEQREAVKTKVRELREAGADRKEIHEAVKSMLKEYGVEIPENFDEFRGRGGPGPGHGFMMFFDQLSDEQRNAVEEKVDSLREQGASPKEIHSEVKKLLEKYGIEVPEHWNERPGKSGDHPGRGFGRFFDQLTEEQRTALHEKVETMHENGATRDEIHAEVVKMLKEYGIDVPDDFGKHREIWENLDQDQRKAIHDKMREMRNNGATHQEIREEIDKMIKEFGINEEDNPTDISKETSSENVSIRSYPNPFNPETTIEYQLKTPSRISISIYDVKGQMIKSLGQSYRQAGSYNIKWDGRNENGDQVPSGIYFIRMIAGNETLNHRIVMMK